MKKDKTYYVYEHVRLDTDEVFYVGIGTKNIKGKYKCKTYSRAYLKAPSRRTEFWRNIFNKCEQTIRIDIVFESTYLDKVKEKEIELIKKYGRRDLGTGKLVNLTDGGEGSSGHKWSKEAKRKRAEQYSGQGNPFYGKTHSEDIKKELSSQRLGKRVGEDNPFYKKEHTKESKQKIGNAQKERWENGELKVPPAQKGKNNFFSKEYICTNHSTGEEFKIKGGIKNFCEEHNLSYDYVKQYKNKGKIKVKKHPRMRQKAINTLNWEFKTKEYKK